MMRHALLASDLERRRIAQDLHDGVIQDLAGLGYVLPTAQRELYEGGNLASPGPRWTARACCSRTWCACVAVDRPLPAGSAGPGTGDRGR